MIEKIVATKEFIRRMVTAYRAPAVLSSFGKESMVLLHLLRVMELELPVIFHRDPWFPAKNKFADSVIEGWSLVVHDWPPIACGIKVNGTFETVARYQVGPQKYMDIPKNIAAPVGRERYVCGLNDVIGRPKGSFVHTWDLCLHGHKSCDVDECDGPIRLSTDHVPGDQGGGPALAFPLKDWSDADVWHYLKNQRVPTQEDRYDRETGKLRENHDRRSNDYITACVRCIDPREPKMVECPKRDGTLVPNLSGSLHRFEERAAYIEKN